MGELGLGAIALVACLAAGLVWLLRRLERCAASLRSSQKFLDAILDNLPDMIFLKDAERLSFVRMNRAGEELLGLGREDLLGKTDHDFFAAEQADFFQAKDRETLDGGRLVDILEEPIDTPRGTRWLHTRKVPVAGDDGRPAWLLGISEDITKRRRTERALRRLAGVFEYAQSGVVVAGAGRDTPDLMNPAWARMHGYTEAELAGMPIDLVFAPEVRRTILGHVAAAAERGHQTFESLHVRKDGTQFPVLVSMTALIDGSLAVHAQDVTELKRSEEELRLAKEAAETTSRELEAFSYSVSHDLRAPLRAIDGFSQALAEDYGDRLDLGGHEYLNRVRSAAKRMGELIDDLLELSRVARAELMSTRVDLGSMAREIGAELARANPDRQVEFVANGDLVVRGDPRLLRVALTNLLDNAWKFTGRQPQAHIELGRAEGGELFIRDNGVGFDMTYAGHLFGPFQRLHRAIDFPGTGIGLATVQRIIHRHGGRIAAEGRLGEGATFRFTLPAEEA